VVCGQGSDFLSSHEQQILKGDGGVCDNPNYTVVNALLSKISNRYGSHEGTAGLASF
jgi:hypothetical protein